MNLKNFLLSLLIVLIPINVFADTEVKINSEEGDYIGQGKDYIFTEDNSEISVALGDNLSIEVDIKQSNSNWSLVLHSISGEIKSGLYQNAIRFPFNISEEKNGLSFTGNGRGCNKLSGDFSVSEISILDGKLEMLKVGFVQYCEGKDHALKGEVYYNTDMQTECVDVDGDGWGWDGVDTCKVERTAPVVEGECVDNDGDGFGWNGVETCNPNEEETVNCIDTDGDGWGWDGSKSCRAERVNPVEPGDCIDTDGDGWGWDGVKSCRSLTDETSGEVDTEVPTEVNTGITTETTTETNTETSVETSNETLETDTTISGQTTATIIEEPQSQDSVPQVTVPQVTAVPEPDIPASETEEVEESNPSITTVESAETTSPVITSPIIDVPEVSTPVISTIEESTSESTSTETSEEASVTPAASETEEVAATETADTTDTTLASDAKPFCPEGTLDEDEDGWAWDAEIGSCRIEGFVAEDLRQIPTEACAPKAAGTQLVSSTSPVGSTGNSYYADKGPQCVVPGKQFDGPGLFFGDFIIINNAWGAQASSFDWKQCLTLEEREDGTVSPSWTYDWGNEDDLAEGLYEWETKSYPEIIYGVKERGEFSGDCETTGLPIPVVSMPKAITIDYSYTATETENRVGDKGTDNEQPAGGDLSLVTGGEKVTGGDRNVAIESFFHTTCDIKRNREGVASNSEFEVMLWLESGNERMPAGGDPKAEFTDSQGRVYNVFTKPNDPKYVAYVAQNTETTGSVNWKEFIDDARLNSEAYGARAFDDSWCLANILFGSEIWWGEGEIIVDKLMITSEY